PQPGPGPADPGPGGPGRQPGAGGRRAQAAGPGQGRQVERRGVVDRVATIRYEGPARQRRPLSIRGRQPRTVWPPRTTRTWPVRWEEAPLARKTAGPVTSSARPQRPIGTVATVAFPAVSSSHRLRLSSVAVQPGHRALTRTPCAAHSTASVLVSEI